MYDQQARLQMGLSALQVKDCPVAALALPAAALDRDKAAPQGMQ